ncbi:hypothetical protein AB1Y20_009054 [Prymnesium parvum]|uniref:EGF-like domain-containing protein n=1 Tax=Prymnesium parvum TaxID=97485 RepID=A0AB34K333_PRYPA
MRLGVRPLVTLALCCAVLIWSSRPQYQERTPPRAEPADVASHRLAQQIRAIEREVRRTAREMEAAGVATAAAADLFSSLKPLVRVQQQAVDALLSPRSDRAVEAAPRLLPTTAKACAPGCEKMGNCNAELGRCDCQPFMGGDDCSKPLFDACQSMIGLKVVAPAPCVYDTLSQMAPVSCECLRQCESIGLMGVRECYVIDSKDEALSQWVRTQRTLRGLEANMEYWKAALAGAEEQSVQECGGRGVYAPAMPNAGAPRSSSRRCRCYAGFTGPRCEQSSHSRRLELCINACSNRGKCMRNWCHCDPGFYGVDCSLGSGNPGAPPAHPLPAPIGAQTDSLAPKLYIYELPPQYNSWMHAGSGGWWQDLDLWGEDVIIHRRALRSIYRVTDPAKADFFLVPIWVSSAMWQESL